MLNKHWYFIVPASLIVIELLTSTLHPYFPRYAPVALSSQPFIVIISLCETFVRVYLSYLVPAILIELLPYFRRWQSISLYIGGYGFFRLYLYNEVPSAQEVLRFSNMELGFILLLLWSLFLLVSLNKQIQVQKSRKFLAVFLTVSLVFLWGVSPSSWKHLPIEKKIAKIEESTPSFILFSTDSVPGSYYLPPVVDLAAPNWAKVSKNKAITFSNAYSVTNSTYTSWYSILSGQYPFDSKVETLYPNSRVGSFSSRDLLPNLLRSKGYQTVFMTDCSTSSYMEESFGFEKRYQVGVGFIDCAKSLLLSNHPLTTLFDSFSFFPENESFCSAFYQGDPFFSRVERTIKKLERKAKPYFLAVHSCLAHRQLHKRLPPKKSIAYNSSSLKKMENEKQKFLLSIQMWDKQFKSISEIPLQNAYFFSFSDHGSRIWKKGHSDVFFSHGWGLPLGRHQYHVPLLMIPPESTIRHATQRNDLVSLMDLYPTILDLAKIEHHSTTGHSLLLEPKSERSLILTSAIPMETPHKKFGTLFQKESHVDAKGKFFFSAELDKKLLALQPVSIIKLPYRLMWDQKKQQSYLYNEIKDPHNLLPLVNTPSLIQTSLYNELCQSYPRCLPSLPVKVSLK